MLGNMWNLKISTLYKKNRKKVHYMVEYETILKARGGFKMKRNLLNKTRFFIAISLSLLFLLILGNTNESLSSINIEELDAAFKENLKATKLGIGGGGALFEPAISPFNSNDLLVVPDMGGLYISHDKGLKWNRVNMYGTVISATFDPNRVGVIYAGGSGLYRSTDNGDSFELIFPRKDDIVTRLTHNENGLQYYFTKSGKYDRNKYVKSILIDPEDSNHIFILCYSYGKGKVFESIDNGEDFNEIFTYEKSWETSIQFDFNELIYRRETRDVFVINDKEIIGYNLDTKTRYVEHVSEHGLVDVTTVYENGKTYFIIIEKVKGLKYTDTIVYYTNDFKNKVEITDNIISVEPNSFHNDVYGDISYKYYFRYIAATSLNNIYVTNMSYQETSSIKPYPYTIDGIIRYHDYKAEYLFGNPFKDHNTLTTRSWADGNTYALGIAASKQNEEEFLFTTLCGVVYSSDGIHLHPRYSTVTEGVYPNSKYVTSGIDEQATYGVSEDPFHEGVLLLLNTDLGLIRSEDNGASWSRANDGIPNKWSNTIYDAVFDERRENYVYSIWSGRHNAPYSAANETDNRDGGFAISKDGGKTWDSTYSSGLPKNTIPVKMAIVYPDDTIETTIYVATFNEGFFVSYDSGRTFVPMNDGIDRVIYKDQDGYRYILASDIEVKDGHIFGITAKNSYSNDDTQAGELFEYINGEWEKIPLPKNARTPKDIYYHDGILYVTGTATAIWEYKNGIDWTNYGGGVYAYQDGTFTQIFDEGISTTSVQIDSRGTMYVSDINGHIYRKEKDKDYQKIYDNYFYISKELQLSDDGDYLYLASFGGGLLKLENLNSLYHHECTGGHATCLKRAICEICGQEYGNIDPNYHESTSTHIINRKDPTYNEEGYSGDIIFDCCNAIKEKGKIVPKLYLKNDDHTTQNHEQPSNTNDSESEKGNSQNREDKDEELTTSKGDNVIGDKKEDNTSNEKQNPLEPASLADDESSKKICIKLLLLLIILILLIMIILYYRKIKKR